MTSDPAVLLPSGWAATAALMVGLWWLQRRIGNAGVVDAGWCVAFAGLVAWYALVFAGHPARRILLASLAGVWGVRLAVHLYRDRLRGKPEDGRYRTMRLRWGSRAQVRFFLLYQAEALALLFFTAPLLVLMRNPRPPLTAWEWAGLGVWVVAIGGEWLADRQLARFRADPANRGRTCRVGLWRYSRHPNYFFESLHWWAYVLMGVGVPLGWLAIGPAAAMLISLLWISGVPLAEAQALATRGDDYREYQRRTSLFIPWFPRPRR